MHNVQRYSSLLVLQIFTKSFLVAEYVLPKFEVDVELPDYATFSDGKTVATIKAQGRNKSNQTGSQTDICTISLQNLKSVRNQNHKERRDFLGTF